jgi:hypothetical protein
MKREHGPRRKAIILRPLAVVVAVLGASMIVSWIAVRRTQETVGPDSPCRRRDVPPEKTIERLPTRGVVAPDLPAR